MVSQALQLDSVRNYLNSTMESGFKNIQINCLIHRTSVDGSRSRKKKWTGPKTTLVLYGMASVFLMSYLICDFLNYKAKIIFEIA